MAIGAVVLNFALNCCLIGPFSYVGLALSTALSAWFNAIVLGGLLVKKNWIILDERMKEIVPRLILSSGVMGFICYGFQHMMTFPQGTLMRIGVVSVWIFGAVFSYIITARLVGAFHFRDVQKLLKNQPLS